MTQGTPIPTATNLQQAYDLLAAILTSVANGSFTIQRGSGDDTDAVFTIKNGAGTIVAKILGNGMFELDGDLMFTGSGQYRLPTNSFAFVSDAFPLAGIKFSSSFGGSFDFINISGNAIFRLPLDQSFISDFGLAFPSNSPAQITSDQNNYSQVSNVGWCRISSDAARDITGFLTPSNSQDGKEVKITNIGSFNITLKHLNGSSSAPNRIIGVGGVDVILAPDESCLAIYDAATFRWRIMWKQ